MKVLLHLAKNPIPKYRCIPPVGVEPSASDFNALHATIWPNSLFAGSLRRSDLYSHDLFILGLRDFLQFIEHGSIRIFIKVLRLLANRELAQTVAYRTLKTETLGSIPIKGNILLLDFFFVFL